MLIVLAAVSPAVSVAGDWLFDADAGILYDSNLTRAQAPADIRADGAAALAAAARNLFALGGSDTLTLGANLRGEAYWRFRGLNVVGLGAEASYRHKFGLGWSAPWAPAGDASARY